MPIKHLFSYLVEPGRNEDDRAVLGTEVVVANKLTQRMSRLFDEALEECDTEIIFQPDDKGAQNNPCRDELLRHTKRPTLDNGRSVAARLQKATTHRSARSLLFLATGSASTTHRLVVARFPADEGIIAHERPNRLDVEFVERIFLKNTKAYKCAVYEGTTEGDFWTGNAVDYQINGAREISDYWIRDFLLSELRTTPASGTKRMALAMREAIHQADDPVKTELIAGAQLIPGRDGKRVSPNDLVLQLGLSAAAADLLRRSFHRPELMDIKFQVDRDEFARHAPFRSVRLDNGATLIGRSDNFETVIRKEPLPGDRGFRFTTEGQIVKEELRKTQ